MNFLITLAMIGPSEGMTAGNPAVGGSLFDTGELCVSRVDAIWAVVSYVVTDTAHNAVVGAKPNASRHP